MSGARVSARTGRTEEQTGNGDRAAAPAEWLAITDSRTGRTYEIPIEDGTVRATALRDIKLERRRLRADGL